MFKYTNDRLINVNYLMRLYIRQCQIFRIIHVTIVKMYLCIFCQLEVTWEDSAVICDECDQWQHRRCHTGISEEMYLEVTAEQRE